MKPFSFKFRRWAILYSCLTVFLFSVALVFFAPWQRVMVWSSIQYAEHGPIATRRLAIFFWGIDRDSPQVTVPVLLSCLEDKNYAIREMAALSLGHIHQYPEQVVPALLTALNKETNYMAAHYLVGAIGMYGTDAKPWSPIFLQMIQSNSFSFDSGSPLFALKKINPEVGAPLVEQYLAGVSNRQTQAQLEYAEKQRRKALAATNPPPAKP